MSPFLIRLHLESADIGGILIQIRLETSITDFFFFLVTVAVAVTVGVAVVPAVAVMVVVPVVVPVVAVAAVVPVAVAVAMVTVAIAVVVAPGVGVVGVTLEEAVVGEGEGVGVANVGVAGVGVADVGVAGVGVANVGVAGEGGGGVAEGDGGDVSGVVVVVGLLGIVRLLLSVEGQEGTVGVGVAVGVVEGVGVGGVGVGGVGGAGVDPGVVAEGGGVSLRGGRNLLEVFGAIVIQKWERIFAMDLLHGTGKGLQISFLLLTRTGSESAER